MSAEVAPGHRIFKKTFSVADVRQRELVECIDFTVRINHAEAGELSLGSQAEADIRTHLGRLGSELPQSCAEHFSDRPVLATCVATTKQESQVLELVERYYNFTTLGMDDIYMQECLKLGGTWQAVAQDSPEFRRAQRDAILRGFEAMAEGSG